MEKQQRLKKIKKVAKKDKEEKEKLSHENNKKVLDNFFSRF